MTTREIHAAVVLTGDELLRGFVQDANSIYLAGELRSAGVALNEIRVAGDTLDAIEFALHQVRDNGADDLVIVTGGLGPTHDDRTAEAVARVCGVDLELRADALELVEARVRALGRMQDEREIELFTPGNHKQATLPVGAELLTPAGTAPGFVMRDAARGTHFVVLPGPPGEMRYGWRQARAGESLQALLANAPHEHERIVRVWGVPESYAAQELEQAGHVDDERCRVTLCARDGELELSLRGADPARVNELADAITGGLGDRVFAVDDERPTSELVGAMLLQRGQTLAVAESCTGGMLGSLLTATAGTSAWFRGGVISYDNDLKRGLLNVPAELIDAHGAVSPEVARAMADGAREAGGADVAISITGIAGPGGGSDAKPVGTVHVGIATPEGTTTHHRQLAGGRDSIRARACVLALHALRVRLLQSP